MTAPLSLCTAHHVLKSRSVRLRTASSMDYRQCQSCARRVCMRRPRGLRATDSVHEFTFGMISSANAQSAQQYIMCPAGLLQSSLTCLGQTVALLQCSNAYQYTAQEPPCKATEKSGSPACARSVLCCYPLLYTVQSSQSSCAEPTRARNTTILHSWWNTATHQTAQSNAINMTI